MKEVEKFINKYFSGDNIDLISAGKEAEDFSKFMDMFFKSKLFDCPDLYNYDGEKVYIFEHFEFDGTVKNRKGSSGRKELSRIESDFSSFSEKNKLYTDKINATNTSKSYIQSLFKTFNSHYLKINSYKERIKEELGLKKDLEFIITFLIEDNSIFGSHRLVANRKKDYVMPCYCEEFLNLFEKSIKLDYVICTNFFQRNKIRFILSRNNIKFYKENSYSIESIEFISYEQKFLGYHSTVSD